MVRAAKKVASKSRSPSQRNAKAIEKAKPKAKPEDDKKVSKAKTQRAKPKPKKKVDSDSDDESIESSVDDKKPAKPQTKAKPKKKPGPVGGDSSSDDQKKVSKKSTKKEDAKKEPAKEDVDEKAKEGGGYVFFKNPKYMKQAEKLAKSSPEEVKALVEKEQYSLAEKIHVGNLLSGIAAKIVQLGVKSDKYCYEGAKHDEYLKKYDELMGSTVVKLKELLVLNDQPKTATKDILCERVADGFVLGKIPKCPVCLGGRFPLFNRLFNIF